MSGPESAEDPADVVKLRAAPPPVARLSRPVILALGGLGAVAIGAAMTLALQGRAHKPVELKPSEPESQAPPPAMVGAPKTYAEVPTLGPPLPGDLGRPILSAQERGQPVVPPAIGAPDAKPDPAMDDRRRAVEAARTSSLFLTGARASSPRTEVAPEAAPSATPLLLQAPTAVPAKPEFGDPANAQPTRSSFAPTPPVGKLILQAQTVITAALITAVNSDLPGPVSAQVTRHVFDSLTGRTILIPQGSKLIGVYEAQVAYGQRRVRLAWDRVIFPNGSSLQLDRLAGADAAGRSGLSDGVDAHWGSMAKAAVLSSILGVGAELGSDSDDDVARALRRGVQDTVNQTGQQVVRQQLDVKPTLTLRAGMPLSILVTRDIVFDGAPGASR